MSAGQSMDGVDVNRREAAECWHAMPDKAMFFALLGMWFVLFHIWGDSTFGFKTGGSLFSWLYEKYDSYEDNQLGFLIPPIVLVILWWKRKDWLTLPKNPWWPGIGILGLVLLTHILGYAVQQARISTIAFFIGIYAIVGLVWGYQVMRTVFFPFFLFGFSLPLSGGPSDAITLPLRFLATRISCLFAHGVLGINVIQEGTRVFNPTGTYQYEVAAACSGLRSLTAISAIALIYAFCAFKSPWRRALMIASAVPLAILANVFRLTMIIIAAEAFGGQKAGNYVHSSSWMSLLPYVPAICGVFLLGHWLREDKKKNPPEDGGLLPEAVECK
jgi:exosortase